jgi:GDP-mannose 6-dehydrogenase
MIISIFGLGYVGMVSMGCLSKLGHRVIGIDINKDKVDLINEGKSPIIEKQLGELISEHHRKGLISATQDVPEAVINSDVSFICVGTPSTPNGHLDMDAVYRMAHNLGEAIITKDRFHVVAIRSTVMPGTNEEVTRIIEEISGKKANVDFAVVSNPEFLREGSAVKDYFCPPYTLLGSQCTPAIDMMKHVYEGIDAPMVVAEIGVAEMIKHINNAFHALKITFANEVGNICKKIGVDSHKLMDVFCMDTRLNLSSYYLKPGFAYGGSCLPKDLKALSTMAHDLYLRCPVIENIDLSNELQKDIVLNQIIDFGKQKIGFLGLSFKAGTDDLRHSPVVDVLEKLLGKGFDVRIYDRNINLSQLIGANRDFIMQRIPFIGKFITGDVRTVLRHSEVLVIVNNEREFMDILPQVNQGTIIYDLVNLDRNINSDEVSYSGIAW